MKNRKYNLKLAVYLNISLAVAFVLASIIIVLVVNDAMHDEALEDAESTAEMILERNLATHAYFSHDLKPEIFNSFSEHFPENYFEPSWMSSTYAIRQIDKYFKASEQYGDYYYKECAIDARSPQNEADDYEKAFIEKINRDKNLKKQSDIRDIEGQLYFVTLHKGETMQKICLSCHSTPDQAPGDLIKKYGSSRSFNRAEGDVVSAVSIRIPLQKAYATTRTVTIKLSAMLLAILLCIFATQFYLTKKLILKPLKVIQDKTTEISFDSKHLGEELPLPPGKEFRTVVSAFNNMSAKLRNHKDNLEEEIANRTAQLKRANDELVTQINERLQIEDSLKTQQYYLQKAQQIGNIGSWELDLPSNKLTWTDQTYKIFGQPKTVDLNYDFFISCVHPDDRDSLVKKWQQALDGTPYEIEHRILVDDEIRWILEKAELYFNDPNQCVRAVGFAQDITDNKVNQLKLEQYQNHLEQLVKDRTAKLEEINQKLLDEIAERKRTEAVVRMSEEKFSKIFFASPDAILITTPETGKVIDVNPSFERILGFSRCDTIGKSTLDLNIWDSQDQRQKFVNMLEAGKDTHAVEVNVRSRSGDRKTCMLSLDYIELSNEKLILTIARDITDQIKAQQAIKESEARFRELFTNIKSGVAVYQAIEDGQNFIFKDYNKAGEKIDKIQKHQILGRKVTDVFPGVKDFKLLDVLIRVYKTGIPEYFPITEYKDQRISGWRESYVYKLPTDEIVSVYDDVTERKVAEDKISQMALFAELNPAPVLRFDKDGTILSSNSAAISIMGQNAKTAGNIKDAMCCCGNMSLQHCIENDMVMEKECTINDRVFQFIILGVSNLGIGHIYGTDITERKSLEEDQKLQLAQLAHVSRLTTAGELSSSLAHELNQPLCAIATISEGCKRLIAAGKATPEDITDGIEEISKQSSRAGNIIHTMGRFVRKHLPKQASVNIIEVINESINLIQSLSEKAKVRVNFICPSPELIATADRIQIQQVLINLIQNAFDAMKETKPENRILTIYAERSDSIIEISVKDQGSGLLIDSEKLFEPFNTTKPHGIGIGLSITRSIVEAHGGRIWAEKNSPQGTTFKFTLQSENTNS